jgi:hypothetical protein
MDVSLMFFPMKQEKNQEHHMDVAWRGCGRASCWTGVFSGWASWSITVVEMVRPGILRYGKIWDVSFI